MEKHVFCYLSHKAAVELKHLVHLSCQSINCSFNPLPAPKLILDSVCVCEDVKSGFWRRGNIRPSAVFSRNKLSGLIAL